MIKTKPPATRADSPKTPTTEPMITTLSSSSPIYTVRNHINSSRHHSNYTICHSPQVVSHLLVCIVNKLLDCQLLINCYLWQLSKAFFDSFLHCIYNIGKTCCCFPIVRAVETRWNCTDIVRRRSSSRKGRRVCKRFYGFCDTKKYNKK
jgi:hypothetical protein